MNGLDQPVRDFPHEVQESRTSSAHPWRPVAIRAVVILIVTAGCLITISSGETSVIRIALTLTFFLFIPGLALAELLPVRDLAERLMIATGASLGLETLVALTLVYAGAFSVDLGMVILATFTIVTLGAAVGRVLGSIRPPGDATRSGL